MDAHELQVDGISTTLNTRAAVPSQIQYYKCSTMHSSPISLCTLPPELSNPQKSSPFLLSNIPASSVPLLKSSCLTPISRLAVEKATKMTENLGTIVLGQNYPPPPPPPVPGPFTSTTLNTKPKLHMKQLFWTKIPMDEVPSTIWQEISSCSSTVNVPLDTEELERMFSNKPKSAIMLARIKLTYPDIKRAVLLIDDERLTIDNLKAMRQYVPTSDEIEIIRTYKGNFETLGNAERYFRAISDINRLAERLDCMIFRRYFQTEAKELTAKLKILECVIVELRSSFKLRRLLQIVLNIGNHLNEGTFRGNALGFRLDTLLKGCGWVDVPDVSSDHNLQLKDTKPSERSFSETPTLMHYLARFVENKCGELMNFMDELPHIEAATRGKSSGLCNSYDEEAGIADHFIESVVLYTLLPVSVGTVMASVESLVEGIRLIRDEIIMLKSPSEGVSEILSDRFASVMKIFIVETQPTIDRIHRTATTVEQGLKYVVAYYGEDPLSVKIEDLCDTIRSFASALRNAQRDNEAMRWKTLRDKERVEQSTAKVRGSE
ncbi:hypothetical protein BC938DRAFT_478371 [Jimgerdemannia flammicorona]|uniref:FH2 domain-containing protein n=1 Tax=Jimgerdemannia flammicorona TaxID=994334 RepID=A0A433QN04_9FUNG|nr:hypothetical protein BC938DRAFT_478371 [Jimgerdemannia flammicorona]